MISLIVAIGKNREIGLNNQMLWHIKEDFKKFKENTMGHHMIMGRKTFESIGRPLPGRTTIILTRNKDYRAPEGVLLAYSKEEALSLAKDRGEEEVFICGGTEIYTQFLDEANRLYLSKVDFEGEADAHFPEYEKYTWVSKNDEEHHEETEKSPAWSYAILEK